MRWTRRIIFAIALPILLGAPDVELSAQDAPPTVGFEVGQAFPTLAFPSLEDGQPRSIADFRGKKVVLHVFASW